MEEQLELFGEDGGTCWKGADRQRVEKDKDKDKEEIASKSEEEYLGTPSPSLAADDQPLGTPSPSLAADDQPQEQEPHDGAPEGGGRVARGGAKRNPGEERGHLVRIGLDDELTRCANVLVKGLGLARELSSLSVVWNKRLRTAAGKARFREALIELNPRLQLLESPRREEEIERTFLHELAHHVAHARHRRRRIRPHGPEWRQACADLGIPGESACHDLPFAIRRMRRKYGYRCPECGTVLKRVRRIKHHVACLACCRQHNRGRYHKRFRLEEFRLAEGEQE